MTKAVLKDRALVRVTGPDWRSFLQGLLTQDVEALADGELRYGALLTPQGRLRMDMFLLGEADGALLDVNLAKRDELIQALTLYRLRAQVEIAPVEGAVHAAWDVQPDGTGWIADPRLREFGWRRYGTDGGGDGDYHAHLLALGVLDPSHTAEPLYPIEANLDLLNGIDFRKGCFVGQETTSRMKRRGPVKSRVAPVTVNGAEPGAEVLAGELRAGVVLASGPSRALAVVRIDRALGRDLTVLGAPTRLDLPAWLAPAFRLEPQTQQA